MLKRLIFALVLSVTPFAASAQTVISGWAWSDTIGWVSLSCENQSTCSTVQYGLRKETDGRITGHAWSEHIGWLSSEPVDVVGCPIGICDAYISNSGLVTGWMRALSASGGWDGWVNLRDSGYGVEQDAEGLTGYAWGSSVVGWLLFSAHLPCAGTAGQYCDGNALKYRDGMCAETTLVPDCGSSGCSVVTNQCVIPTPPVSVMPGGVILKAHPKVVQYGKRSTISWSVINADSCTISGNGNSWTDVSGSYLSNPVNEAATYILSCVGPGGVLTGKASISNPPRFREI